MWFWVAVLLIVQSWNCHASNNLYFFVSRSESYCFADELTKASTLLITYKFPEFQQKPVIIRVKLNDKLITEYKVAAAEGKFAFAAADDGEYRLCVEAAEEQVSLQPAKFFLRTQVLASSGSDESDSSLPAVAKHKEINSLQQEISKVADSIEVLLMKIQEARDKETHFRDQSERINERVVWWSVAQTLFLVLAGTFQSLHLRNFFFRKKIA